MKRIKITTVGADRNSLHAMQLIPVDAETGIPIAGVTRCEIIQSDYKSLPLLMLELIEFDVEVTCGPSQRGDK